jgi:hypothetical protein
VVAAGGESALSEDVRQFARNSELLQRLVGPRSTAGALYASPDNAPARKPREAPQIVGHLRLPQEMVAACASAVGVVAADGFAPCTVVCYNSCWLAQSRATLWAGGSGQVFYNVYDAHVAGQSLVKAECTFELHGSHFVRVSWGQKGAMDARTGCPFFAFNPRADFRANILLVSWLDVPNPVHVVTIPGGRMLRNDFVPNQD